MDVHKTYKAPDRGRRTGCRDLERGCSCRAIDIVLARTGFGSQKTVKGLPLGNGCRTRPNPRVHVGLECMVASGVRRPRVYIGP